MRTARSRGRASRNENKLNIWEHIIQPQRARVHVMWANGVRWPIRFERSNSNWLKRITKQCRRKTLHYKIVSVGAKMFIFSISIIHRMCYASRRAMFMKQFWRVLYAVAHCRYRLRQSVRWMHDNSSRVCLYYICIWVCVWGGLVCVLRIRFCVPCNAKPNTQLYRAVS